VWLFPWLSIVSIAAIVSVLGAMAITPRLASQLYCSLLTVTVVSVLCVVTRLRRRQARAHNPVASREYV
jgi:GABA permease